MSLRTRFKQKTFLQQQGQEFNEQIGLLDPTVGLNFIIQSKKHKHKYKLNYFNPLNIFLRLSYKRKKQAFQQILIMVFKERLQQKNLYIPEELLNGNTQIISKYKQMIKKSRLNSYIKLNIRHTSLSKDKNQNRCSSSNHASQQQKIKHLKNKINNSQIFYDTKNLTQRSSHENKNITIKVIQSKLEKYNGNDNNSQASLQKSNHSKSISKSNQNKLTSTQMAVSKQYKTSNKSTTNKITYKIQNISSISKSQQKNVNIEFSTIKKSKSKTKKDDGQKQLNISYTVLTKGKTNNPQSSTYLYQSNVLNKSKAKSIKSPIHYYDTKTQNYNETINIIKDNYLINQQTFIQPKVAVKTNLVEKSSKKHYLIQKNDYQDDIFSQRMSINNSQQRSQITHVDMINDDYFFNDKMKQDFNLDLKKKGKKAIYLKEYQKNY